MVPSICDGNMHHYRQANDIQELCQTEPQNLQQKFVLSVLMFLMFKILWNN